MSKKTVAVLFGGQSSEHEISCRSAINIIHNIDREAYDLVLVGITKEGHWVKVNRIEDIEDGSWRESKIGAVLSPDATEQCLMIHEQAAITRVKIDLVFPILHGLYGEDGTIQGLCKLAKIPFVGCGVTASAVGMDKGITKLVVHSLGITQADFLLVTREMLKDMCAVIERTEALTVIDVNSGKDVRGKDKEATLSRTNREAAEELMHQLRLRNLSGIILVDFIDFAEQEHLDALVDTLETLAAKDTLATKFVDITGLNLAELVRPRRGKSIQEQFFSPNS